MSTLFKTGQDVRLEYNGQTVDAYVELASANGRSLFLTFEGTLVAPGGGMLVGGIPLLQDDDGVYRDLAVSVPALVTPRATAPIH